MNHSEQTTGDSNPGIMTNFYTDLFRRMMPNSGYYWSHYASTPFLSPVNPFLSPFPFYGCSPIMNAYPTYLPEPTELNPTPLSNTELPASEPSPVTPVPAAPGRGNEGRIRCRRQGKKSRSREVKCVCAEERRSSKERRNFPASVVEQLKAWFNAHLHRPYASRQTLEKLSETTGLSGKQVRKWISNQRDRTRITKTCNRQ